MLLVLIAVSTAAAALVPTRDPTDRTGTDTTATRAPQPTQTRAPSGRAFRAVVIDDGKGGRVRIRVGDQLTLTVHSRRTDQVEIAAFGALEPVSPDAPARFDLIADRPGTFPIRLVDAKRRLATIIVVAAKPASD